MQTSPETHELVAALAQARPQFPTIARNKTVAVKSERGAYTFSYATLDSILDTVCPVLGAHGLAILCGVAAADGVVTVTTRLAHKSGQWVQDALALPRPAKVQELGSLITYLKRYSINALLGIEGEADDDGNLADGNAVQPVPHREEVSVNGHGRLPPEARMSQDDARTLKQLAQQAFGYAEGARRLRADVGFEVGEKLSLMHLAAYVPVETYARLRAAYEARLQQVVEAEVP